MKYNSEKDIRYHSCVDSNQQQDKNELIYKNSYSTDSKNKLMVTVKWKWREGKSELEMNAYTLLCARQRTSKDSL